MWSWLLCTPVIGTLISFHFFPEVLFHSTSASWGVCLVTTDKSMAQGSNKATVNKVNNNDNNYVRWTTIVESSMSSPPTRRRSRCQTLPGLRFAPFPDAVGCTANRVVEIRLARSSAQSSSSCNASTPEKRKKGGSGMSLLVTTLFI